MEMLQNIISINKTITKYTIKNTDKINSQPVDTKLASTAVPLVKLSSQQLLTRKQKKNGMTQMSK